jgi:hypothetical protein
MGLFYEPSVEVTFFWQQKRSNQRKLPAAPCSIEVCAVSMPVVAEQDKAGFEGLR